MSLKPPATGTPEYAAWCDLADAVDAAGVLGAGHLVSSPNSVKTDATGQQFVPDPACPTCHGQGRYVSGYSGREDDGNAPLWEECDCFIPLADDGAKEKEGGDAK